MFIREASLCFEYLKTYLLPPLGGENPVGLIKKKWNRRIKVVDPPRHYQRNGNIKCFFGLIQWSTYTLLGKAREASISRTEFLRQLITNAEVKSRIKPEEMQLIRTVSGMANNLNQIAHRLNSFGISTLNEDLNALKVLIYELIKRLKP